jgi:adhesin transport system outer membrane protein
LGAELVIKRGIWQAAIAAVVLLSSIPNGYALTLKAAVRHTVETNPTIEKAATGRRAADYQLRQAQGRRLPTLDILGDTGSQKVIRPLSLSDAVNDQWRNRQLFSLTARQTLFHGWDRANDIYKNAARVDAAALRVLERTEALGLDAVEAYIDVRRHYELIEIARQNVRRHREILELVKTRNEGGKAPISDVDQTQERLFAAEAIVSQIEQALLDAKAKFRRVIGLEPGSTAPVPYPRGLPLNRHAAIEAGITNNPAILVAGADADVARYEFKQSKSSYYPRIGLEGTASWANDIDGTQGQNDELVGKLVLTWNLFDGLIKVNRRRELAERWAQTQLERDVRIREIVEVIDRALAAFKTGKDRVKAREEQVAANRKVVETYFEEYELDKRSLLDFLDAESAKFNSQFELSSVRAVHVFSAYQLLAGTGQLLNSLGIEPPPEAFADERGRRIRHFGRQDSEIAPLQK